MVSQAGTEQDHWGLLSSVATSSWPVLALWMSAE